MTDKEKLDQIKKQQIGEGINAKKNAEIKERLEKLEAQHRALQEKSKPKKKLIEA